MFQRSKLQIAVYLLCTHRYSDVVAVIEGVEDYLRELVYNNDMEELNLFLSDMSRVLVLSDILVRRSIYVPRSAENLMKSYIITYSRVLRTNSNLLMTAILLDHSPTLSLFMFRYLAPKEYVEARKAITHATNLELTPNTYIGDDETELKYVPAYFTKVGMTKAAVQCLNTMLNAALIAPPQFEFLEIASDVLYTASKYEMTTMCEFAICIAEKFMIEADVESSNTEQTRKSLRIYMNNYNRAQRLNHEIETLLLVGKIIQETYIREICERAKIDLFGDNHRDDSVDIIEI